ncbi:outer-membrane immunogenic protein [Methylobacterium gnaphalii]|uniref:Outer-membrane immunogenic protein n=1 Tax=Methylobacterium gnaphalii TaxID=1010610 RepID=A0A512JI76_9HYPH|nr:outer-membrane immunogenic protein [Methylobacterium gnaphalii]GLS50076.1 outer-membrane immunogenic protein [Methylobacterium gnaphalii]
MALALASGLGQAWAADLPLRSTLPPMVELPPAPPVPVWSGFHVDLDGGYTRTGSQNLRTTGTNALEQMLIDVGNVGRVNMPSSSFVLRGGFGYDLQPVAGSGLVLGLVTDALYTEQQRDRTAAFSFGGNDISLAAHQSLDFLGTLRGRLGYGLGPVLVYGTGGLAYGQVSLSAQTSISGPAYTGIYDGGSYRGIETGYVYGGGIEWMAPSSLMPDLVGPGQLAFKAEYLRYDLGRRTVAVNGMGAVFGPGGPGAIGHTANAAFRSEGQLITAGLTYRFSGAN